MSRGPDPDIEPADLLEVFVKSPDPAFIASEIADEFDISGEGARHRLNDLVEKGLLHRKKPGPRTVLYWISEQGEQYYAEHGE